MTLKATFFYNQGRQGFSETWYIDTGESPSFWVQSLTLATRAWLSQARSPATSLYAVRASDVDTPRRSALRVFGYSTAPGFFSQVAAELPDPVTTTAVIRFLSNTGVTRRLYMRGLKDDYVVRDLFGNDAPPADMQKAMSAYTQAITGLAAQIRYTVLPPAGGLVWKGVYKVITNADNAAMTDIQFYGALPLPAGFSQGSTLVFQGAESQRLPNFPRLAEIVVAAAAEPTITIAYRMPSGGAYYPSKMRATARTYAYANVTSFEFERFSEHKSGKPFGSLRGRSKGLARVR